MDSRCEKYSLLIQALADGELSYREKESSQLFLHLSSCKSCRDEYFATERLKQELVPKGVDEPKEEWFQELERRRGSSIVRKIGYALLLVPYIIMIAYSFYGVVVDGTEPPFVIASMTAAILGVAVLLGYTILGRVKELKTDRYKEVIR